MFVFGNALFGLAVVLDNLLWVYQWVLIITAVLSWVRPDPFNPIVRFLHAITDPPIRIIRRRLPASLRHFPLDVAWLVLFAFVLFARYGVVPSIVEYSTVLHGGRQLG